MIQPYIELMENLCFELMQTAALSRSAAAALHRITASLHRIDAAFDQFAVAFHRIDTAYIELMQNLCIELQT